MKRKYLVLFAFGLFLISCTKDEPASKVINNENQSSEFILDENRMDIVDELLSIYDKTLSETLDSIMLTNPSSTFTESDADIFNYKFQKKVEQYVVLNKTSNKFKSAQIQDSVVLDTAIMNHYFNEFVKQTMIFEDGDKDYIITNFNKIVDNVVDSISNNAELSNLEKQLYVEYFYTKTKMVLINIEYVDINVSEGNLKSALACGFWCKMKHCWVFYALDMVACGFTVSTILSGCVPGFIICSTGCMTLLIKFLNCWDSY